MAKKYQGWLISKAFNEWQPPHHPGAESKPAAGKRVGGGRPIPPSGELATGPDIVLAGTEYWNNGKTMILLSDDQGETFDSIKMCTRIRRYADFEK